MAKTIEEYLNLPYTIELIPDPDGGWVVAVKELPGCISQGDTPEEALEMIQDAMRAWIGVSLDDGNPIPEPRPIESYSGKFVLRLPKYLHRQLAEEAEQQNVSLNQYINVALAGAKRPGAPTFTIQQAESDDEFLKWPGLDEAIKKAMLMAGVDDEAGKVDEELFAGWLGRMISNISSAFEKGLFQDALKYLDHTTVILRQHMDRSPTLESFVLFLEFQRSLIERSAQTQSVLAQQAQQTEVKDHIIVVNQAKYGYHAFSTEGLAIDRIEPDIEDRRSELAQKNLFKRIHQKNDE